MNTWACRVGIAQSLWAAILPDRDVRGAVSAWLEARALFTENYPP